MNKSIINRNRIKTNRYLNLFPLKEGPMNSFKVSMLVILCVGLLGSLAFAGQHDYADFPLHHWVMIGFPVTPTNASPDAIWGSFFGGNQGNDNDVTNELWRFSRWLAQYDTYIRWGELERDTAGVYTNIGEPTAIKPGWGYWFYQNQNEGVNFTVNGTEADDSGPYYIPIDSPQNGHRGRTMVGNPFTFPIDWKNTEVVIESDEIDTVVSLIAANEMGLIDQHAYPWNAGLMNGETTTYIPLNATDGGALPKWQGFWVEQLNENVNYYIKYKVEHTQGDDNCKYHDAHSGHVSEKDYLGQDGIRETDLFTMAVEDPNKTIVVSTQAQGFSNDGSFHWPDQTYFLNNQGFGIEFISMSVGAEYTTYEFTVTAEVDDPSFTMRMQHVHFFFGDNSNVVYPATPNHGNDELGNDDNRGKNDNGNAAEITILRSTETVVGQSTNVSLQLKVPPTTVGLAKAAAKVTPRDVVETSSERDWVIPMSIATSDGTVKDDFNAIGVLQAASDGYDTHDIAQWTPQGTFLELYFPHNDISEPLHYWFEKPSSVCYDMRADSTHKDWIMRVAAFTDTNSPLSVRNKTVTIRWDASEINDDWELQLQAADYTVLVEDMKTASEYTFTTADNDYSVQDFVIMTTFTPNLNSIEGAPVAESFTLLNNYPNPFNPTTTIQYQIPRNEWVQLAIYNLQGELVKTLWNGDKAAGDYRVQWNGMDDEGRPVASGVYLTKLLTPTMARSTKMLLLK